MTQRSSVEQYPGFALVRVSGGPYERGLQHGRLLRGGVRRLREAFYRDIVYFHGRPIGLAFLATIAPILLALHRHIPGELRREMRGVAAGAGVPYWDILILNCFDDMLHSLWRIPPLVARLPFGSRFAFACSSFALLGQRTQTGRLLHGRNLDYEVIGSLAAEGSVTRALKESLAVIEYRPEGGHAFLSVGWPGVIGVLTGINQAGLSLACLTSTVAGETPNGVPLPLLYRQIIQTAATFAQAEQLIRRSKLTIGNNLMLSSGPANDARVYELSPGRVGVRTPKNGSLAATNHFGHEWMISRQNGWVAPSSVNRQIRLENLCLEDNCSFEQAAAFLRDTLSEADGDLWSCLENPGTVYSTVAEPASGRLWLRVNDRPGRDFVALSASWATQAVAV